MQTDNLESRLSRIEKLDRAGLIAEWASLSPRPIPKNMHLEMVRLLVAYTIQAQANPKLVARVQKRLAALAREQAQRGPRASIAVRKAPPGSRLLRAWKGETHEVTVLEDGFSWKDKTYKSLSEIARAITGTRWNGPRFFGLRDAG